MLYAVCLQLQSQISVCVHEVAVVDEQQSTTSQHCQDGGPRVLYESTSTRTRSPSKALSTLATIVVEFGDYSRRKRRQFVAEFGDSHQNGAIDSRRFRWQSPNSASRQFPASATLNMNTCLLGLLIHCCDCDCQSHETKVRSQFVTKLAYRHEHLL